MYFWEFLIEVCSSSEKLRGITEKLLPQFIQLFDGPNDFLDFIFSLAKHHSDRNSANSFKSLLQTAESLCRQLNSEASLQQYEKEYHALHENLRKSENSMILDRSTKKTFFECLLSSLFLKDNIKKNYL